MFLKISQNSQENTKKEIQMFSCEFCKISHSTFLKEPFGFSLHKRSFYLLSHHDLSPFQKQPHIYSLSIFFGLICRLKTRISSIFQTPKPESYFQPDWTPVCWLIVASLNLNFHCNRIYTTTLKFQSKSEIKNEIDS